MYNSLDTTAICKKTDSCADAFAVVAIITIIVSTVVFWLYGMA